MPDLRLAEQELSEIAARVGARLADGDPKWDSELLELGFADGFSCMHLALAHAFRILRDKS